MLRLAMQSVSVPRALEWSIASPWPVPQGLYLPPEVDNSLPDLYTSDP